MMRPAPIQCRCGRILAHTRPVTATDGEGYSWHEFIKEVRGDCSRCGSDVIAAHGWWLSWDAWDWEDAHTREALP
jgi:hypothetical protein